MPEITLKFNLPDERQDANRAIRADDWYIAVYDIITELRSRLKFGDAGKEIDDFNDWVWSLLNERGLDPYEG